jgi:hypothetical protein
VAAKTWEEAKTQLDPVFSGTGGCSTAAEAKTVLAKLPKQAGTAVMIDSLSTVQTLATNLAAGLPNAPKLPGDLPKTPAYFGAALSGTKTGYQFQLFVPNSVGPVVEKGLLPIIGPLMGGAAAGQ